MAEIPETTKQALDDWAEKGWLPGGFTQAVLRNDLFDAMARADRWNRAALFEICTYIRCRLPAGCWGSQERIDEWMKFKSRRN